jgi:hypothetical protein
MTTTSADAERVEVHITYEPDPSPARQLLWRRLWERILAPDPIHTNAPEPGSPEASMPDAVDQTARDDGDTPYESTSAPR